MVEVNLTGVPGHMLLAEAVIVIVGAVGAVTVKMASEDNTNSQELLSLQRYL